MTTSGPARASVRGPRYWGGGGENGPGRIGCGPLSCSAGEQCCAVPLVGVYQCYLPPAPTVDLLPTPSGTCLQYRQRVLTDCDDSLDCAADEACCATDRMLGGRCEKRPGRQPDEVACGFLELCHGDASCRATDARCFDGQCRRASVSLTCGGEVCTPEAPYCCEGASSSESHCGATCRHGVRVECRSPADCLAGQHCCVGSTGESGCWSHCALARCTSAADCARPWQDGVWPGRGVRCVRAGSRPFNVCQVVVPPGGGVP
ncbi:MAG: hypothetical protein IT373_03600 [Polyangiaceae bacterium]|nr:hypothetical protein [Polyangiaceae bacterium]